MKNNLFLLMLFVGFTLPVFSQSPVQLNPRHFGTNGIPFVSEQTLSNQNKREERHWYNFMVAADAHNGGAIIFTVHDNNVLFPDSSVQQRAINDTGGAVLRYASRHHVGQIIDPKSFYYTNLLTEHVPYRVDSISFAYRYSHVMPGTVDTLEFQVYSDTGVQIGSLVDNTPVPTAWVKYDRLKGQGASSLMTWRILLDEKDTSWAKYKIKALGLPTQAQVGANQLFAVTYRYIPGYTYSLGDTIDHTWEPTPSKLLNQFQPLIGIDSAKTEEDTYNHGLTIRSFNKYDSTASWADEFIAGNAWSAFNEHVYIGAKIAANVGGLSVFRENSSKVYPNPSMGSESITITFTTNTATNVTVEVYDLLGNKIQTAMNAALKPGQQVANVNISDLSAGIYVYSIKAGGQVLSGKLSVIK